MHLQELAEMRLLHTPNLTLEPQLAMHAAEMFGVLSDAAIYEFESEPPQSLEGLRERYAELESRRSPNGREMWLNWVVRRPGAGLIGYVQATLREHDRSLIAYEFGSAYWGRGWASEAVDAMIRELGARYGIREIGAILKCKNLRSLRLLQRNGFERASATIESAREIERDEQLMLRRIGNAS